MIFIKRFTITTLAVYSFVCCNGNLLNLSNSKLAKVEIKIILPDGVSIGTDNSLLSYNPKFFNSKVKKIYLKVSSPKMETIKKTIPTDTLKILTAIPAGNKRTFTVIISTDKGDAYIGTYRKRVPYWKGVTQKFTIVLYPIVDSPMNLAAAPNYAGITLSWDTVFNAEFYNIYWSDNNITDKSKMEKITGASIPFHHVDVKRGKKYNYIVTADNGGGYESPPSNSVSAEPFTASVNPLYENSENWNDYIKKTDTKKVCEGTETGNYSNCIHAGEIRVIEIEGKNSCNKLTAVDFLEAFNWSCDDKTTPIRMISTGLKKDKYLSDLIDMDKMQWKENHVTVYEKNRPILRSNSSKWWKNKIKRFNKKYELSDAGTIYIDTNGNGTKYNIMSDKISLIVHDFKQKKIFKEDAVISANNKKFIWIEGNLNRSENSVGILLDTVSFSVIKGFQTTNDNGKSKGIHLVYSSNNLISNIVVLNNYYGILLEKSNSNIIEDIISENNSIGIGLNYSSNNMLLNLTATNNITGIEVAQSSKSNIFTNITSVSNAWSGIYLSTLSNYNTIMNINSVNNYNGIYLNSSNKNTLINLASYSNYYCGVCIENSSYNYFTGELKFGNNYLKNCHVTFSSRQGLVDSTCTDTGETGINLYTGHSSDADFSINDNVVSSFYTKKTLSLFTTSAEKKNDTYITTYPPETYRGWYNCQFEDNYCSFEILSLLKNDTGNEGGSALLNTVFTPKKNNMVNHRWSIETLSSCTEIPGSEIKHLCSVPGLANEKHCKFGEGIWEQGCYSSFVTNSYELSNYYNQNSNTLCEEGETCLYTPNIASYQGHGRLVSVKKKSTKSINNIKFFKYEENGYRP